MTNGCTTRGDDVDSTNVLRRRTLVWLTALVISIAAAVWIIQFAAASRPDSSSSGRALISQTSRSTHNHYLYVFPDEAMFVYDIDRGHRLVAHERFPGIVAIRGVAANPGTHALYIAHGGDGDSNGNGSLLKYDLLTRRVIWDRSYPFGIDQPAVSNDGSRIYMPDGALTGDGRWYVIDAGSGQVVGNIGGGAGPHNTIAGLSGRTVYLGGASYPYLEVASTRTNRVIRRIGPLKSYVRPFTVNGRETLAYTTATGFLGFQVSRIRTGRVLYTVTPRGFTWKPASFFANHPSHGISLSPDERQIWLVDAPNSYVHVFDITGLPARPPRRIADIKLPHRWTGNEANCVYACEREGWLLHSRNGCFVYVADSGDVLSAVTRTRVAFLSALRNTRKLLEIDWRGGVPVTTTTRFGLGYVTGSRRPAPPKCGR